MTNNDLGKHAIVEAAEKITVANLLRKYRLELKEAVLRSAFEASGVKITLATSRTGNGGTRFWFTCPNCGRRVGVLMRHPSIDLLGCRSCLSLIYAKQRFKGMPEDVLP